MDQASSAGPSPITLIELADTAVKIGLGAIIAGLAAYVNSRASHTRETDRELRACTRKSLEEIAELTEEFTSAVLRYWALMSEWGAFQLKKKEMPRERKEMLDTAKDDLWVAWKHLTVVEGRLLLLGEEEAQKLCREFGELVGEFAKVAHQDGEPLTREESQKWRSKILDARLFFYKSLQAKYIAKKR